MAFTSRILWLPALACAALLGVAGCGQESTRNMGDDDSTAVTETEETAPTTTETPSETSTTQPSSPSESAPGTGGDVERPESSRGADEPDRCHADDLTGSLEPLDSAAGNRYADLVLTNDGDEACGIYGYGGLELVDEDGTALPTRLERVADPAPTLVELAPGESATKLLHWGVVPGEGDDPEGDCGPDPTRIRVIPPDETDSLNVDWDLGPVCQQGKVDGSAYVAG
ncbi:hypothetical protein FHR81_005142 [Actinoalloteichus hoggarensis]|uniref:Uncharacterized protein n=1 Tax=Actinoalloteichus hoggarensis TaxID=1470176 RepID=A0A221WAX1_9PSEU|nr:DUF4232 domain-containing protein [Actinoalloteichus hoggarensis]ASO22793.1 hypothetical protein AHOG_25940 [Actinoalloteichus hoggarensis]MBB5924065.1 hypothetical protein [Actinoalloteichus hoggarensis]